MAEGYLVGPMTNEKLLRMTANGGGRYRPSAVVGPSPSSDDGNILAVTPAAGIAAMTDTTFPLTFPFATCYRVDPDTGDYFDPPEEVVVFNMVTVAIAGQVLIQAKSIGSRYFVDVDNCSGATLGLPPTVTAPGPV